MSLGICCKKMHLVGVLASYSVKIHVIFSVQFERGQLIKSKPTYVTSETCTLYSRVF